MHKTLRIQLPDLRYVDCTVDFSVKTFNSSVQMCKDLGLRHPEELSLCKPLDPEHLRMNYQEVMMRRRPPPPTKEVQLPDLRYVDCTVDFSVKTFNSSVQMCKDLGLRHPEELSLCKPLDPEHLRMNYQE